MLKAKEGKKETGELLVMRDIHVDSLQVAYFRRTNVQLRGSCAADFSS